MTPSSLRRSAASVIGCVLTASVLATAFGHSGPQLSAHLDDAAPGVVLGKGPSTAELRATVAADEFLGEPTPGTGGVVAGAGQAVGAVATLLDTAPVPAGQPGVSALARHVSPSCSGTGSDGNRVQVIYAVEQGGNDRYGELLTQLRSWVADVDDTFAVSAAKTGGGVRVRWVHEGCVPVINREVLPAGALTGGFGATMSALKERGYTRADRKYLVFAEAGTLCGIGQIYTDAAKTGNANDGAYPTFARVDSPCWVFEPGWHSTAAHELMHMLGGIQDGAPNSTQAGHCHDETDVMCYDDGGSAATMRNVCAGEEELFDCRNDDYFNTAPASGSYLARNWNSADSSFLDRVSAPAAAPKMTITGATTMRAGLSATYTATRQAGVSYRWSATPAVCLPGTRTALSVQLTCPSWRTGSVKLTLAASTTSGASTELTRTIRLLRSPNTKLSSTLHATKPRIPAGKATTLTVRLAHGDSAVRGTVTLFRSAAGTWKRISPSRDTGADGRYTWTVSPRSTTRYAVVISDNSGDGWRKPGQPTAEVRVR